MKKPIDTKKLKLRLEKIIALDTSRLTHVVGGSNGAGCQIHTQVGGNCNG